MHKNDKSLQIFNFYGIIPDLNFQSEVYNFWISNKYGKSNRFFFCTFKFFFRTSVNEFIICIFSAYANTLDIDRRKKRSLDYFSNFFPSSANSKSRGIIPRPSNKSTNEFWRPVKNHQPYYNEVKPRFKAGNQTYKLIYNNKLSPKKSTSVKRKDVHPVFKGYVMWLYFTITIFTHSGHIFLIR